MTNEPLGGSVEYPEHTYVGPAIVDEFDDQPHVVGWQRWRWLLIPFLLGLALLGWGFHRLRQTPPPTTAELAVAQCQYQMGNLSFTGDDESAVLATLDGAFPNASQHRDQALTAAKKVCLAHLCSATDPRLENLTNIAAEEFAFAVTPGHLFTATVGQTITDAITGASWCHG